MIVIAEISQRTWYEAINYKAKFISDFLKESPDPVLWLDADAEINGPLKLFEKMGYTDFALYREPKERSAMPFRSGTLWFAPTVLARSLAATWASACEAAPRAYDQVTLYQVWKTIEDEITTRFLPETYCHIFDHRTHEEPVITHYQASRQHRRKVVKFNPPGGKS